ncbi:MAG: hypothetical protein CLLPBCKN_001012 [Chroococcidiopsis cubana SAG 39.79]|nr:hypothetical protein [Chroococcidiopsis cubana SAG 39.79]
MQVQLSYSEIQTDQELYSEDVKYDLYDRHC